MTTLPCKGYLEFKDHAHVFLAKLPGSSVEEAESGYHCLTLLYLGLETTVKLENDLAENMLETCHEKLTLHRYGQPMWSNQPAGEE